MIEIPTFELVQPNPSRLRGLQKNLMSLPPDVVAGLEAAALDEIYEVVDAMGGIDVSGIPPADSSRPPKDGMLRGYRGQQPLEPGAQWRAKVHGDPPEAAGGWVSLQREYAARFGPVVVVDFPPPVLLKTYLPARSALEGTAQFILPPHVMQQATPLRGR